MLLPADTSAYKLTKVLGPAHHGLSGSTVYFVEESRGFSPEEEGWLAGAKLVLERYQHGLLLRFFRSNQQQLLPLPFKDIALIRLTAGKEPSYQPKTWLARWWLGQLQAWQVNKRYRRYLYNTGVENLQLELSTNSGPHLRLRASGYSFEGQEDYLKSLPLRSGQLQIVGEPK